MDSDLQLRVLPRLIVFSALASLIFLMHLFAFGIYALLIASYELGIALRQSDRASFVITHIAVRLGQFAPAAILWIWVMESDGYYKYTGYVGLWGTVFHRRIHSHVVQWIAYIVRSLTTLYSSNFLYNSVFFLCGLA